MNSQVSAARRAGDIAFEPLLELLSATVLTRSAAVGVVSRAGGNEGSG